MSFPTQHENAPKTHRQGVVLFIVVIVIALVSLSAYGFVVLTQTEFQAAQTRGDQLQVKSVADAGWEYMASLAASSRYERFAMRRFGNQPALFRSIIVDDNDPLRPGRFSIVSPLISESFSTSHQFGITNESAKLSLALVLRWDTETPGAGRAALMQLPGMTEFTADAILDWIDKDDAPREFGAEADFYQTVHPQRKPPNSVPLRMDELLQVRGVSRGLLFGTDVDRNYRVEAHERPHIDRNFENQFGQPQRQMEPAMGLREQEEDEVHVPWANFLTTYSAEKNENAVGLPRINLNQRDLSFLHRQLEESFTADIANFVVTLRINGPYEGSKKPIPGDIPKALLTGSPTYEIESAASLLSAKIAVGSDDDARVFSSPLGSTSARGNFNVAQFLDDTTTSSEPVVEHRLNINLAHRETIMAIPGLPAETVEQMVTAIRSHDDESESRFVHPYWLVENQIIDAQTFELIAPYLTVGGNVFSGQIVAYYDSESPWYRFETVIDGTGLRPRKLYYGLLNHLGRGFLINEISNPIESVDTTLNHNALGGQNVLQ